MSKDFTTIIPGKGLGDLRFGMTRNEVKKIIGEPDEIEQIPFSDDENDTMETWHYDEHELSISFEKEMDNKLTTIAISALNASLNGEKLIDQHKDTVMAKLALMNLGEFDDEIIEEDEDSKISMVSCYDSGLIFWFENDILTEIQLGMLEDE
ncbi:MAG TPA: hypothetical protein PK990_06975 [Salinivirgaceae bacterium]|nr:hypothetical protein [Salinivirgaceae bacterium]